MEKIKISQWRVKVNGKDEALFTPFHISRLASEEREIVMAIAAAIFGGTITELEDEGMIQQPLTPAELHVADERYCSCCEGYGGHADDCLHAQDGEMDAAEQRGDMARDEAGVL